MRLRPVTMRLRPALEVGRSGILGPMDKVLVPVRDLTDSDQNQAVLDVASALLEDHAERHVPNSYGPAVEAEAIAAARSRGRLGELAGPIPLTVVWAMYGETGR